MGCVLTSDITNYLFTLKEIRSLPIHLQAVVHEMTDIYLSDKKTEQEKDIALYNIFDIYQL